MMMITMTQSNLKMMNLGNPKPYTLLPTLEGDTLHVGRVGAFRNQPDSAPHSRVRPYLTVTAHRSETKRAAA